MYRRYMKRILDVLISVCILALLWPFMIIIAVLIKLEDSGCIFYYGDRIGQYSEKFKMIKFRTMKENAADYRNKDGSTFNSKEDPRVTKIGKFLRSTSIDELPQLWNIIKGDMSLLGPRASTWDVLNSYHADETDKMKVRPGISGLCQAYYRNGLSVREKRLKDAWYANHVTFYLDLKIFFKTIITVTKKENLYTNSGIPENITNKKVDIAK